MYNLENGIEWATELKEAFKHNITRAKLIYYDDSIEDYSEINENNFLKNLILDEQHYISNYGFVGTATSRKLEVNLIANNDELNLENKELELKIGADTNSKNILDVGTIQTKTSNGVTCTYDSTTQEITFNGTCTKDNTLFYFNGPSIPIIKNKTKAIIYYVSGNVTNYAKFRFFDNNFEKQINFSFVDIATQEVISFVANDNFTAVNNGIRFNAGSVCNNLKIKVMLTNDTTENIEYDKYYPSTVFINYGNFLVNKSPEIDETNGTIRLVAYDYMIKFNKPYEDRVTYPCSLLTLLQDVCSQAGVTLGSTNFANKNFVVENNQFEGFTLRQVLQEIGKCAFSWARIGQDNKLYLDFDVTPQITENITINEYKANAFKKANKYYGPVNQVTYADSDIEGQEVRVKDQQSIDENGLKELVIYDNLLAYTPEKRNELIQAGTRLLGLEYMPITQLELIGFAYLDCRDAIEVGTLDNQTFNSRVFSHQIRYNGTLHDSIITEGSSDNEEAYKNTATNVFQDQQTRILVDKANKNIQLIAEDIEDNYSTTTEMNAAINLKANEITSTVSQTYSTKTETINAINNLEIGSRNYMEGTYSDWQSVTLTDTTNVVLQVCSTSDLSNKNLKAGDTLRISCYVKFSNDIRATGTGTKQSYILGNRNVDENWQSISFTGGNLKTRLEEIIASSSKEGLVETYITLPNDFNDGTYTEKWQLFFRFDYYTGTFYAKNLMVCKGDKYLDWTPAPEDIENELDTNYYTKSEINQTTNSINLEVAKKVNDTDLTGANIMLRINNDQTQAAINADKISLAGKTINMTSDNIAISSTNFNVDKNGNLNCSKATITDGEITLISPNLNTPKLKVKTDDNNYVDIGSGRIRLMVNNSARVLMTGSNTGFTAYDGSQTVIAGGYVSIKDTNKTEKISLDGTTGTVTCVSLIQTSKESAKKNIKKYTENATEIVKNSEIYTYNFKSENDDHQKHIGFVIGDEGGNYKTPEEVISNGEGIEPYTMTSILWKAVQEQQKIIEELQKEIKELKEERK